MQCLLSPSNKYKTIRNMCISLKEGANKSIAAQRDLKRADARQVLQVMAVALAKKPNVADVRFRPRPAGLAAKYLLIVSPF